MNEEEAREKIKWSIQVNNMTKEINGNNASISVEVLEAILNLLKKKNKEIETHIKANIIRTNKFNAELEKKDKIIASIKEYAQQEINFATEDIEDYIDDDREGNKDIIGELKEWREHWKDIIRIMNNEKTYMDY